jgi:Caspase domain
MAKVALLIGVSEYEPGLNPLPAAVKDIEALQRVLKDSEMGGFDEVKALPNPDRQTMESEIETLFSGRAKDDLVLLFFSGHGIKDDGGKLYFATRITRNNPKGEFIRSTAVPANFVQEIMNNSRAKRQTIILDCCFSGAFDPALLGKNDGSVDLHSLGAEGRVVLTSSSSTQYSFEQQGSDLSIYTRYLVEGIETGAGDRNEDGFVSVLELHEYAVSKVQETAPNMTPKLITLKDMGFEIVLAKAKVTDPKLRYRRQVERYSSRGSISSVGRTILEKLQTQLGLSLEIAREVETEVLRPYHERLENLQRYQQAFAEAVKHEYPLNDYVQSELEDLRAILGLRQEDIEPYQKEVIERQVDSSTAPKNFFGNSSNSRTVYSKSTLFISSVIIAILTLTTWGFIRNMSRYPEVLTPTPSQKNSIPSPQGSIFANTDELQTQVKKLKNFEIKIFYKAESPNSEFYKVEATEIQKKLTDIGINNVNIKGSWTDEVSDYQIRYEQGTEDEAAEALKIVLDKIHPKKSFRKQTIRGSSLKSISIFFGP